MRLLLDSQTYLWWGLDHPRLSAEAKAMIASASDVFLSFVTPWEFELKAVAGKMKLPNRIWLDLALDRIEFLPARLDDCLAAARLPMHHKDPFDRMIIAQAIGRGLTIATADRTFELYDVPVIRV